MSSLTDNLTKDSPLIGWLVTQLPAMVESLILAILIALLTARLKLNIKPVNPVKLAVPMFIILTVVKKHAPKLLVSLERGLGFAVAILLLGEASPFLTSLKQK
jgi:hypothetical protein